MKSERTTISIGSSIRLGDLAEQLSQTDYASLVDFISMLDYHMQDTSFTFSVIKRLFGDMVKEEKTYIVSCTDRLLQHTFEDKPVTYSYGGVPEDLSKEIKESEKRVELLKEAMKLIKKVEELYQ